MNEFAALPMLTTLVSGFLLIALIVLALTLLQIRHLFAAAMLMGFFSLLSAAYYVVVDAVDVAFTEAAVGAGMTTVLLLSALSLTTSEESTKSHNSPVALLVSICAGLLLLYGTADMPAYGAPDAPVHQPGSPAHHFIHESEREIGVPNIVTSVLASYRGYDTFGETTVIFTAGLAVFLLLGANRKRVMHEGK